MYIYPVYDGRGGKGGAGVVDGSLLAFMYNM